VLAFFVESRWQQLGNGLVLRSTRNVSGVHPVLGPFSGFESTWQAGQTPVICAIHAHTRAVTFTQLYPNGANGTNVTTQECQGGSEGDQGCESEPFGYFPNIDPKAGLLPNMTYFGLSGNMNEYHESGVGLVKPYGGLPSTGGYKPDGPTDSGPFVMFEEEPPHLHMMLTPANNFMTFSQQLGTNMRGLNGSTTEQQQEKEEEGKRSGASTSTSTSTSTSGMCGSHFQHDADYSGADILVDGKLQPLPCNSSAACCGICAGTAGCNGFVWIGPEEKQKQVGAICRYSSSHVTM
jgi:hypothetical protein